MADEPLDSKLLIDGYVDVSDRLERYLKTGNPGDLGDALARLCEVVTRLVDDTPSFWAALNQAASSYARAPGEVDAVLATFDDFLVLEEELLAKHFGNEAQARQLVHHLATGIGFAKRGFTTFAVEALHDESRALGKEICEAATPLPVEPVGQPVEVRRGWRKQLLRAADVTARGVAFLAGAVTVVVNLEGIAATGGVLTPLLVASAGTGGADMWGAIRFGRG
jgi:hypothetical protein